MCVGKRFCMLDHESEQEARKLERFIDKTAKEVEKWPDWMKGKPDPVTKTKRKVNK